MGIVAKDRVLADRGHVDDLEVPIGPLDHASLELLAEADRLAVVERDEHRRPVCLARNLLEGAVVEDVAVLIHLDERRSVVGVGRGEGLLHVGPVHVVGPRDEGRLGADGQADRVEGMVDRAERSRLGHLAGLRCRRVLPLGQPIDLVVEDQDVEPDVAPEGVDEVIAADAQGIAVATDHPDVEVRAGHSQPGSDRRCTTVDRVHPVGVHVVREPRGAADP